MCHKKFCISSAGKKAKYLQKHGLDKKVLLKKVFGLTKFITCSLEKGIGYLILRYHGIKKI